MKQQFLGDKLEPVLTSNDSMIPQPATSFFDQASRIAPSQYPTSENTFSAPEGPADYIERLAQGSAERANWKIQVTQAHTTQIPQVTSGPAKPIFDAPPSFLEEMAADSSSEAMDIDSGIVESPSTLDAIDSPNTLGVSLQISDASMSIPVEITDLETSAKDALVADYSEAPQIIVSQMVMRDLLETFIFSLVPTVLSSGKIFEFKGQDMVQLARILTEQSSVAIVQGPSSLLILYPSHLILEERVFLERDKTPIEQNCHICVQVRAVGSKFPSPLLSSTSNSLPKNLERYFQKNHNWDPKRFFTWQTGSDRSVKKNVYIMTHHISHKAETEMLARYFRELGAKVWTTGTKGSWDDFLKFSGSGVIIVSLINTVTHRSQLTAIAAPGFCTVRRNTQLAPPSFAEFQHLSTGSLYERRST